MSERSGYTDGEPCWADVMARNPEASRAFYTAVLGWTYQVGGPEFGGYTLCMKNGRPVAGLTPWQPQMGDFPAVWSLYLATSQVERALEQVTAGGGQVLMGPMDIPGNGRMAMGTDPGGACFALWQGANHPGFGLIDEPGSYAWAELASYDPGIDGFYQGLFGYDQQQTGTMTFDYTTWSLAASPVCGRLVLPAELRDRDGVPPHWSLYFAVEDVDVAVRQVETAGGRVSRPAHDSPYGRVASVADPEGAPFEIIDPTRKVSS